MKKDNTNDIRPAKPRLRVVSINLLHKDNNPDKDENSSRDSKRSSRSSDEEKNSDLPEFYHHPRRPRNFDPL